MQSLLKVAQHTRYHAITTNKTSIFSKWHELLDGMLDTFTAKRGSIKNHKVSCILCGWTGNHFIDFHTGYNFVHKKTVCPNCFSHPRHRSYKYTLDKIFSQFNQEKIKVLHFAPEAIIAHLITQYPNVDYLNVDIDHRKAMRKEDITQLSFANNSFDFIMCIHVLEHIPDDKKAMQELYRVLKPNGIALLDVPIDETSETTYEDWSITSHEGRTKAFWQWDHVRLYGLDFPKKLRAEGFVVTEDDHIKEKGKEVINKQGLEATTNYLCTKQR
jgi:SAM-dependent methyltransferase